MDMNFLPREPKDHGMSIFLVLLCCEIFVLAPLARTEGQTVEIANGAVFSLLLLVGVLALAPKPVSRAISGIIVAAAIVFRWSANLSGSPEVYLWDAAFSFTATMTFLTLIIRQLSRETPVTEHKIMGAVAAYLLTATAFASLYNIIELLLPGSFSSFAGKASIHPYRHEPFLYFSVSTITTVGFGDITAIHPLARSLVMLESIIGILYPPVLIGILVSLHLDWRKVKNGMQP